MDIKLTLIALVASGPLMGASFDCQKAKSPAELRICSDRNASQLDEELAAAYSEALRSALDPQRLRTEQRDWIKQRDRCVTETAPCDALEEMYRSRIATVRSMIHHGGTSSGAGAELDAQAAETASDNQGFRFRLTRGTGTEVCDAYLKRLRATHFERPPYCGRPENNLVPGFALLQRNPLSSTQILALEPRVFGLMSRADQYWMEHEEERWKAANSTFRPAQPTLARVEASLRADFLRVWRYEPPIDVENNGSKDNLIIWFGEDVGPSGSCGTVPSNIPEPLRMNQLPFFLMAAGDAIDVDRTMKVFGAGTKDQSAKAAGQISKPPDMIGSQFSFFAYNGVYYFDTFPNAASIAEKPGLADTLAVFLHKDGQTRKVCEYSVTQ